MAPNKAVIYLKAPEAWPVPGEHLDVQDIGFDESAPAPPNGLTVEVLYLSLDPYLRGRMREPNTKSYFPSFQYGQPLANSGLARVLKSNVPEVAAPGDIVEAFLPFAQYAALDAEAAKRVAKLHNPHGVEPKLFLGALGMPGRTAYSSLYEIGKPKKGETIFISAASGAVGQIVGQLAKHEGLRVIGSVGSDEKLDFITGKLGFDGGFNYKKEKATDALARLAPQGVDIYYENVGGEQLDAALVAANDFARFVMCGMISQYNVRESERYGVKNLMSIVGKRITMRGFIVGDPDFGPKWGDEHRDRVGAWLKDGSFKTAEHETKGLENAPQGLIGMLKGDNFGKAFVTVKDI